MGLHISILKNWKEHPDWDTVRQGNDEDFYRMIGNENEFREWYRPKDFTVIRNKIHATNWENKDRYLKLLNILEADKEYEVHISM